MKLKAQVYASPIPTEGIFNNVFIEETKFEVKRSERYFSIKFEMYYYKGEQKIILGTSDVAFLGMNNDAINSNRPTIISVPNANYDSEVASIPTEVEVPNPEYNALMAEIPYTIEVVNTEYNPEVEGSQEFITVTNPEYDTLVDAIPLTVIIPNPDYDNMVASVPRTKVVPMFKYIREENNGEMPTEFTVVDWGYPTYEDVLKNFTGGTLTEPELNLNSSFAKGWLLNNLMFKGDKIGTQFEFIEAQ